MGAGAWVGLAAAAVLWELACTLSGGRWPGVERLASALWRRPLGRLALVVAWGFVGVHVFARYTVPG